MIIHLWAVMKDVNQQWE